jgi:hypothetical protein
MQKIYLREQPGSVLTEITKIETGAWVEINDLATADLQHIS